MPGVGVPPLPIQIPPDERAYYDASSSIAPRPLTELGSAVATRGAAGARPSDAPAATGDTPIGEADVESVFSFAASTPAVGGGDGGGDGGGGSADDGGGEGDSGGGGPDDDGSAAAGGVAGGASAEPSPDAAAAAAAAAPAAADDDTGAGETPAAEAAAPPAMRGSVRGGWTGR